MDDHADDGAQPHSAYEPMFGSVADISDSRIGFGAEVALRRVELPE